MNTNIQILWRHPEQQPVDAPCSEMVDPGTETLYPFRGEDRSLIVKKCLPKNSLLQLVGDHSGETISCLNGVIWITEYGNPEDILVSSGETFRITRKGAILIEGLVESSLQLTANG